MIASVDREFWFGDDFQHFSKLTSGLASPRRLGYFSPTMTEWNGEAFGAADKGAICSSRRVRWQIHLLIISIEV